MARIAVVHPDFDFTKIGGEEVICMHVLEALQDHHDLSLFTFASPELKELNEFASTEVDTDGVTVSRLGSVSSLTQAASTANRMSGGGLGLQRPLLIAAFNRLLTRRLQSVDYAISTSNELTLPDPSMQYIHFPRYNLSRITEEYGVSGPVSTAYDRFCATLGGITPGAVRGSTLLTNSNWTADVVESIYGTRPRVVYPPLDTEAFGAGTPWEDRQSGFVSVGRLTPAKNVLRNVEIVRQLYDRGHDVHLHLVGPTATDHEHYRREIERKAAEHEFVHLDGRLDRDEMIDTITSHRYGLHGKKYEHFGIAVAELVAGGTIPFIRNASGQREVVNEQEEIMYDTVEDAVEKIERVLESADEQRRIRDDLPDVERQFGRARFKNTVQDLIEEDLAER